MRKYSGKSIPFSNLCYAASESFLAAARLMGDESFVLIPDGGFHERDLCKSAEAGEGD